LNSDAIVGFFFIVPVMCEITGVSVMCELTGVSVSVNYGVCGWFGACVALVSTSNEPHTIISHKTQLSHTNTTQSHKRTITGHTTTTQSQNTTQLHKHNSVTHKHTVPILASMAPVTVKSIVTKGHVDAIMQSTKSCERVSLFFSKKCVVLYVTGPA